MTVEDCSTGVASRGSAPAATAPGNRFLPAGVPGADIERVINAGPGNETASGKFDSPGSSAALAAKAFRLLSLPAAGAANFAWLHRLVLARLPLEETARFPWRGGRRPLLDCLVVTPSALKSYRNDVDQYLPGKFGLVAV